MSKRNLRLMLLAAGAMLTPTLLGAAPIPSRRPAAPAAPPASAPTPQALPGGPVAVTQALQKVPAPPRMVLALYYGWYGTPAVSKVWSHYEGVDDTQKRIATHVRYPAQGPYDSLDPKLIDRHLGEARQAGIDGLVCSWWGRDDITDRSFAQLLARARGKNVSICPMYERISAGRSPAAAVADLTYLLQRHGRDPSLLRLNKRPVIFLYAQVVRQLGPQGWLQVTERLRRDGGWDVAFIADASDAESAVVFDGLCDLRAGMHVLGSPTARVDYSAGEAAQVYGAQLTGVAALCQATGRVCVATVAPGLEPRTLGKAEVVLGRNDGAAYQGFWDAAIAAKPHWILVNSFNQWHSGTEIEPSVELGDAYLKQTRACADRFRGLRKPAAPAKK